MFLVHVCVLVASPLEEPAVTVRPYRPQTPVAGELTDSLILLPLCSTTLASQRLSLRWSTSGMITWVPLDTRGREPAAEGVDRSAAQVRRVLLNAFQHLRDELEAGSMHESASLNYQRLRGPLQPCDPIWLEC